ncbi:LysR family transcriptional regulator [Pseudomonas sessilinigenes]|uniref:LysR family transcriptional regulator n=1 Tax=Pseudomonas sessilinigenes TaxID=658629 RepID=A0ABX8MK51_9PSED|nr:LysR substrate-binding domain-containing protein [Pseudomonas sessilinigenes]AZC27588.1 LysR family regulatory protein CidR [Pseudomonas sessilinigenes]QXH38516.1 LysR family transcriptional regulator [Pseudomonas sessilinigenes]
MPDTIVPRPAAEPSAKPMEQRLELRHLRYFKAVAEELSFTRAAAKLHMAQPPLSQQIKQLEEDLGVVLFERQGRPLRLTEAGRQFLLKVRGILDDVQSSVREVRELAEGHGGRLSIGFAGSVMYNKLPELLGLFRQCYPGVELEFRELLAAQIGPALLARDIDLGLARPALEDDPAFQQRLLLQEPLVVAVPTGHRLAGREDIAIQDLDQERTVLYPRFPLPSLTDLIQNTLERLGVHLHLVQHVENLQAALGLTRAGVGLTFVPQSVGAELRQGIVFLAIRDNPLFSPLSAAWLAGTSSAPLRNFLPLLNLVSSVPSPLP